MNTNEKLSVLRKSMQSHNIDTLIIPSSDAHMSEYLPECAKMRNYFSGFTGSAGTLVVTKEESGLWVDGRYFVQAAQQLDGSEIVLYRMKEKGVPTINEFLKNKMQSGQTLGIDGSVISIAEYKSYKSTLAQNNVEIKSVPCAAECWQNRPSMPATQVYTHDIKYTGDSAAQKLDKLRKSLAEKDATSIVICGLPSVAWLLNIRASDIANNPYALAFCAVSQESATLFINCARVPASVQADLKTNGVLLSNYGDLTAYLSNINKAETFLLDRDTITFDVYNAIEQNSNLSIICGTEPVLLQKAIKNSVEISNIRNAHIKDGCAMVKFQMQLEQRMASGQKTTEIDICDILRNERMNQPLCMGESFGTIAAYGANAAMMHYSPNPATCATLEPRGFLLVDSGAQYLDGTTDITRTYSMGNLTERERKYYTYVLKSNLNLAKIIFMEGCSGANVDIIARAAVWEHGIDYRCGTGHGVGFLGGVHEGPHSMRTTNTVPFLPGMIVTNEPGIYEENDLGIRIETELLCVEKMETVYGKFYGFECITYCPIDLTPVIPSLLNAEEINCLNEYHANVYKVLSPFLNDEEQKWLHKKTQPLAV